MEGSGQSSSPPMERRDNSTDPRMEGGGGEKIGRVKDTFRNKRIARRGEFNHFWTIIRWRWEPLWWHWGLLWQESLPGSQTRRPMVGRFSRQNAGDGQNKSSLDGRGGETQKLDKLLKRCYKKMKPIPKSRSTMEPLPLSPIVKKGHI